MLKKCRLLYKGDMVAALIYIFVGNLLFIFAASIYYFAQTPGYKYLSYGFFMFFIYCVGKGSVMYYMYSRKYYYYKNLSALTPKHVSNEKRYTEYRINKKNINRRRYVYMMVASCLIAVAGIFLPQKSILMGSTIPIALITGIELCIGLLTEFRLREYDRILNKPLS